MTLDKPKEGSELSGFNINKLSTDAGLVEFAKLAKNVSLRDMKKWWDTGLKTKLVWATDGDVLYKDYLHRRLGMWNKNEIDSTTMVALKKIAESGKVTKIPYTTQTKGKEVAHTSTVKKAREATAGTQSIESIVSIKNEGVTQDNAKKILELLPTSNGLPTKKAVEMWDRILLSEKKAIQRNIWTKDDGILGRKTLLALQKRANNEVYAGDNFEFPKNPVVDKKLAALATTVDAVDAKQSTAVTAEASEVSTTVPSSEITVAETKTTASETFVDTPEKQATRKPIEEAEAARLAKIGGSQTSNIVNETANGIKAAEEAVAEINKHSYDVTKVILTPGETLPKMGTVNDQEAESRLKSSLDSTTNTFSSLNEKYDKWLNEVVETFDPSKYTYINFSYDVASEDGKKSEKITEVVRIDNKAFGAAGINKDDLKWQNAYKLMHIIRLGSQSMPDWFQNINDIKSDAIPAGLTGEKRVDFVNTVLSKKQKDPIKLNILTDANKYLGSISKTATLGLWTAGKEGVKDDARKSDMKAMQEEFARTSRKLVESNSSENLSKYYTKLITNADNIQGLSNLAKNDPILRDILKELELDVSVMKTWSFGSFTDGSKLKAIQKEITSGRREEFANIVDTKIKAQGTEVFIFREGQFQFSDTALQAATSSNGNGILKGNTLNEKGESTDIYLTANKLDKTKNIPEITSDIINESKGKVVPIKDFEWLDNAQLYISQSGDLYLINSPKHIGALSQMLTTAGDRLSGDTAEKVYIAVWASLLTLAATNNLGSISLGTPHIPRISGQGITTQRPEMNANLNNAVTGYAATALFLYADIAKLEAQTRKYGQASPANADLYKMAQAHGGTATEQLKQAVLASSGIPTTETK